MKGKCISVNASSGDVRFLPIRRVILRANRFADRRSGSRQTLFDPLCFSTLLLLTQCMDQLTKMIIKKLIRVINYIWNSWMFAHLDMTAGKIGSGFSCGGWGWLCVWKTKRLCFGWRRCGWKLLMGLWWSGWLGGRRKTESEIVFVGRKVGEKEEEKKGEE